MRRLEPTRVGPPEVVLGECIGRRRRAAFGLLASDRLRHVWVVGKTGVGKSSLLEQMIDQDVRAGRGLAVLDPHGSLSAATQTLSGRAFRPYKMFRPQARRSVRFNPLARGTGPAELVVDAFVCALRSRWRHSWGPRMEHILRHAVALVLEHSQPSVELVYRILVDAASRQRLTKVCRDPQTRQFWEREFESYPNRLKAEAVAPVLNKLGAFLSSSATRRALRPPGDLDLHRVMDNSQVLVADLSVGHLGESTSDLLGTLLLTSIAQCAMRRSAGSAPFIVYVDEVQRFMTDAITTLLSESRKFGVGLVAAHQYLAQLPEDVRHAFTGNVGTLLAFRIGPEDAVCLAPEFGPPVEEFDLVSLPRFQMAVRLLSDGEPVPPFIARTLPPPLA